MALRMYFCKYILTKIFLTKDIFFKWLERTGVSDWLHFVFLPDSTDKQFLFLFISLLGKTPKTQFKPSILVNKFLKYFLSVITKHLSQQRRFGSKQKKGQVTGSGEHLSTFLLEEDDHNRPQTETGAPSRRESQQKQLSLIIAKAKVDVHDW